ncbi:flippase [Thermodesulfobacteriota bacterium]
MGYNIFKNFMFSAVTKFSNFFMVILLIIACRIFGDKLYGELSIIIAFVYLFENLIDLGIAEIILRDISRVPEKGSKYLGNLISWKLVLCVATFILVYLVSLAMPYSETIKTGIYLFTFSAFFKSIKYSLMSIFKAYNRYGLEAASVTFERFSIFLFGVIVLTFRPSILNFVLTFLVIRFIDLGITFIILNRMILKIVPAFDFTFIKSIQLQALPMGIYVYVAFLYGYIDTIMLSLMKSSVEVGWYNAAYRIYEGLAILPFILYYAVLPPLSKNYVENKENHQLLSKEAIQFMLIGALPIAAIFFQQSELIVKTVFGIEYLSAIPALKILMPGVFFLFIITIFNCLLISMDRLRAILYFTILGLAVNVISNLILIPIHGFLGAALSTSISATVIFSATLFYIEHIFPELKLVKIVLNPSYIIILLLTVIAVIAEPGLPRILVSTLYIVVYVLLLFLFKLIDLNQTKLIMQLVSPVKT